MRKLLIGIVLLMVVGAGALLLLLSTGTVDSSSLRMLLNVMMGASGPPASELTVRQRYQVADGFSVKLYSGDVPKGRFLRITPAGDLLVSRPHAGDIVLLRRDANGDGKPDAIETVISGLRRPQGLDISGDWLYIAESHRLGKIAFDPTTGTTHGDYVTVVDGLTDNGNHWSKTLRIGPDNLLYLTQGSTCNICTEADARRATLMRFALDGSAAQTIATGLRNSVGFDWAPWSGELFATDNGRDLLGDDYPPCELNQIVAGAFYGWPYYNGNNVKDPDMGPDPLAAQRKPVAPVHDFAAHNAPLGIAFLNNAQLPSDYQHSALVALHGSWNRSTADGYKVVSLHWTDNGIEQRDFLSGFNQDGNITGRPVDVTQGPDGSIYISDDYAGAIYRVRYTGENLDVDLPLGSSGQQRAAPVPDWVATADLPALARRGGELYEQHQCGSCHEAGENPKVLQGLGTRLGYDGIMATLTAPQSPMPVYPLTTDERRALAAYLLARETPAESH